MLSKARPHPSKKMDNDTQVSAKRPTDKSLTLPSEAGSAVLMETVLIIPFIPESGALRLSLADPGGTAPLGDSQLLERVNN